jgi:hypothetical protein
MTAKVVGLVVDLDGGAIIPQRVFMIHPCSPLNVMR